MEKCKACSDYFKWDDEVIEVDDEYYHKDCVTLYPTGYVAFLDYDCLGETENADGTTAYSIFEEGQYIDDID
ncbi:hypothetical protein P0G38_09305 [Enterococcus casseliflavus]|uniref:hypothetical protein n=1 Tax=Enterococcus casseliflavus TaxID=37734 RepID=UPI0023DB0D38|nr:hypothetical protein [Enterococcus casseliflavus]WEL45971.1 hypothetical protein P0G38_09305 [Enterococcus casseliflavus]